jgi:hypothetical protein
VREKVSALFAKGRKKIVADGPKEFRISLINRGRVSDD